MFDINSIKDASSADVELKHPVSGEPLGAIITIAGPENGARKSIEFARQRKLRKAFEKTGKLELTDPAEDELDVVDKLAVCTLGWSGITDGGVDVPFSKDAAAKLYAADGMGWLRAQVYDAMDQRERFITACAKS